MDFIQSFWGRLRLSYMVDDMGVTSLSTVRSRCRIVFCKKIKVISQSASKAVGRVDGGTITLQVRRESHSAARTPPSCNSRKTHHHTFVSCYRRLDEMYASFVGVRVDGADTPLISIMKSHTSPVETNDGGYLMLSRPHPTALIFHSTELPRRSTCRGFLPTPIIREGRSIYI